MKTQLLRIVALIALIFTTLQSKAQPDYFITLKGDSTRCFIRVGSPKAVYYKLDTTKEESFEIKTDSIKRFFVANDSALYTKVIKPAKADSMFLHIIEAGKINLYEDASYGYNGVKMVDWYISKGNDTITRLKTSGLISGSSKKRKDEFTALIKDNKAVYDMYIADDSFTFKELQKLVHYYNTGIVPPKKKEYVYKNDDN